MNCDDLSRNDISSLSVKSALLTVSRKIEITCIDVVVFNHKVHFMSDMYYNCRAILPPRFRYISSIH